MSYRLGVDVGGTFTDLLLVNEKNGRTWSAKVPSTPADQSIGVLNGISRVCATAGIEPSAIDHVMHGTTVATNTVLTGTGAKCGLVTTKGYRQVLQIARSYVPGGLGGWVIYNKSLPMAALALTATLYHVANHAFFKSLLFLGTGSVLHATSERNLGKLGGLIRTMPWVGWLTLLGVLIAFAFVQSRLIETALFPYAVLLQVTPIVAIAPLIIIWVTVRTNS